jgi:SAM-dependent methyltransferase
MKTLLHVGCGDKTRLNMPEYFRSNEWKEIRLDIDESLKPDIVASMSDMPMVASDSVDAIYSLHNLEHLHPDDGAAALREFCRVLKPAGLALVYVPDLGLAAKLIVEGKIGQPAYHGAGGKPVTPLDMLYGGADFRRGNDFMTHRNGFTVKTMRKSLADAGFLSHVVGSGHGNVLAIAFKASLEKEDLRRRIAEVLPGVVVD